MFKITVPASSANLGSGFDTFGLALSLYNVFGFEKSDDFLLVGFDQNFSFDQNLVFQAYKTVFEVLNKEVIPVTISLIQNDIPISRGLGSSSTCIIAGVIAANHLLNNYLSKEECLNLMAHIEGHPDNVSASFYGGLTSAVSSEKEITVSKWFPSGKLSFYALIPQFTVSTSKAREALPKVYHLSDITFTLARAASLAKAFEQGKLSFIKEAVQDKIHEPYRYPLITDGLTIKEKVLRLGGVVTISGSGPTMLVTSDSDIFNEKLKGIEELSSWNILKLKVDLQGFVLTQEK